MTYNSWVDIRGYKDHDKPLFPTVTSLRFSKVLSHLDALHTAEE